MKFRYLFALILLLCSPFWMQAQRDSTVITISGKAFDQFGLAKPDLLIVNQYTRLGTFGKPDGTYKVQAHKSDTLVLGAMGYSSIKVCFADSALKDEYELDIRLYPINIKIGTAEVIAPRDLDPQ